MPLLDSITYSDYYLVANDFGPYIEAQVRGKWGLAHNVWW